jgi:hypothetical protein
MLNIARLLPFFGRKVVKDHASAPAIEGFVTIDSFENGKCRQHVEGSNIWTLTGREYLAELISLKNFSGDEFFRNDRIAFIGLGVGSQPEVANISQLVSGVPYVPGEFLARVRVPATFPVLSSTSSRTAVRFIREYGQTEVSLPDNVILTEAGLFTDGDPDNNWSRTATPTGMAVADRAPMAYKTFEPVTKTTSFTLRVIWEVRFL